MGLLSSVAYGVVASPVLRGAQAKRTKREWSRHSPAGDVTAAESRVLRELLGGTGAAGRWQSWWPPTKDVPDALFKGFVKALEEAYGLSVQPAARLRRLRGRLRRGRPALGRAAARGLLDPPPGRGELRVELGRRGTSC